MTILKENEVSEILSEIRNLRRKHVDVSKIKFAHHDASSVEPTMSRNDYEALLEDIKLTGLIHTPVVLYHNKIIDGRHRQRAAIELGMSMPIIELKNEYSTTGLEEYVRSIHMGRDKTKVQKQIQAYKYKRSVAGITYANAAARYGQSERSIRTITKFFKVLNKNGYASDFDKVMQAFEYGMTIRPDQYEWINKATGTFYGALKQLNEFIAIESIDENESQYDPTEQKEVIDEDTGEVKIVDIEKSKNVFQVESLSKDELVNIVLKLSKELNDLKKKVHA